MLVNKNDNPKTVSLFWADLTEATQQELFLLLGDNANYDVVPIVTLPIEEV